MTEPLRAVNPNASQGKALVFAFGDPEPILSSRLTEYLGTFLDISGDFFRPPVDFLGLASLMNANAYHGPILHFKKNMIVKWFVPGKLLDTQTMKKAALDFEVTGNCYFQKFTDRFGKVLRLGHLPALAMRRGLQPDVYVKLRGVLTQEAMISDILQGYIEFKPGEVIHLKEPDIKQGIYGLPQYLGGIQSVLLSEDATLFRRKFFINGAHMGYILVTTDANLDEETAKLIEAKVKESKGPGNFRSMYLNIPRSSNKEPVQIIPVGNIGSKDEFQAIKEVMEMEMLAMHRVYPGLSAIIPGNVGGFGSLSDSMKVYHELEITAMQQVFLELNEVLPNTPVVFKDPVWLTA
jgi:PBSX family phage portal protein